MNRPQQLQWERVSITDYNALHGEKVAQSLKQNARLWDAFVFGHFHHFELIELRDLPTGFLNADTLYLLTTRERLQELLALAETWIADTVTWHANDYNGFALQEEFERDWGGSLDDNQVVVQVWWD